MIGYWHWPNLFLPMKWWQTSFSPGHDVCSESRKQSARVKRRHAHCTKLRSLFPRYSCRRQTLIGHRSAFVPNADWWPISVRRLHEYLENELRSSAQWTRWRLTRAPCPRLSLSTSWSREKHACHYFIGRKRLGEYQYTNHCPPTDARG
jgi:hypothetical protein